jgi:glutamyl-tRNA reductase
MVLRRMQNTLINLLCSETVGDQRNFPPAGIYKTGKEAIEHIFSVGAGIGFADTWRL